MSDLMVVCVVCGKESVFDEWTDAVTKGWSLGPFETCAKCVPPKPRRSNLKLKWFLALLKGSDEDNRALDRMRTSDEYFMKYWSRLERSPTWLEDTMAHWHRYPHDFSWDAYRKDRRVWIKYNTWLERRARNYHYVVWACELDTLEIY